ncbi:uncharacterized protein METZ01_LOCUS383283 [marine metagenome]|uniref:Uncharacterized protein n=1 Tax=marine metagenome TaxID=408172 RepID=A0A382U811_9ZZZZ|tara:strand:+ start:116 stop:307 length:192 start_codon:yes stop_codon:yes gene_type:complete
MKGAIMNKTVGNTSFVYGPQTHAKVGVYGAVAVIAFVVMLVALYAPEISTIGEGIGLDYNFVP